MSEKDLLEVKNLHTSFRIKDEFYDAVDDVNFKLKHNEILAIVGNTIGAIPIIILTNIIRKSIMNSTRSTCSKTNDSTQEITSDSDSSTSLI